MDVHEKQQFDFLLHTSVERYAERLEQRNGGASEALSRLRQDPDAEGIWLTRFTQAVFEDFLLNNVEGACFVLKALAARPAPAAPAGKVESTLNNLAQHCFAQLLRQKTDEALEKRS